MATSRFTGLIVGCLALFVAAGCMQRMSVPPLGEQTAMGQVHGGEIELVLRGRDGERLKGELIAFQADTFHVLTARGLVSVHRDKIARSSIQFSPAVGKQVVMSNVHRPSSALRAAGVPAAYARFPGGWPPELDRSRLLDRDGVVPDSSGTR